MRDDEIKIRKRIKLPSKDQLAVVHISQRFLRFFSAIFAVKLFAFVSTKTGFRNPL